jgi:hypothetical protein
LSQALSELEDELEAQAAGDGEVLNDDDLPVNPEGVNRVEESELDLSARLPWLEDAVQTTQTHLDEVTQALDRERKPSASLL